MQPVNIMRYSGPLDPAELRTLTTAEIALRWLPQLATSTGALSAHNSFNGAKHAFEQNREPDVDALLARMSDAWAWMVSHGLIGPMPAQDSGWSRLTERGRSLAADPLAATKIVTEDLMPFGLHRLIEPKVRPVFERGDFETAAFAAMKEVEVRVRALSAKPDSLLGTKLMHEAFAPAKSDGSAGPLTDTGADGGEQVALMSLFVGGIGAFKNPASHRTVSYDDPAEAAEVIYLGDLLMRLLDKVERRLDGPPLPLP
ncbi:MAG: TIGR02391 family protein [Acidimicrobiia bacterium]